MGKVVLANVFTRPWHSTVLPGCRASSLHQQIARILFLQELPRAPRKGEKQMPPPTHQVHCSPWRVLPKQSHGTPTKGKRETRVSPGVFLGLCAVLEKWTQGMSQPL